MSIWPFRKKVDIVNATSPVRRLPDGTYEMVWERRPMPSPGAMNMSWETRGMPLFDMIGAGIGQRQFWPLFSNVQVYIPNKQVPLFGMPIMSGQFVQQPLGPNNG